MTKKILYLVVCLLVCAPFGGCGSTRSELPQPTTAPTVSNIKIRVVDVSNETHELFEVDVIGLMWSAMEDSLRKRGMLWKPDAAGLPLTMEAHIVKYQEGSVWYRWILPPFGKTVLTARCDLKEGGRVIASAEADEKVTFAHGTFTIGAWRKIFEKVAEDLVGQVTKGL